MIAKNVRLGEVLIEYGYITEAQLDEVLALQKEDRSKRIGDLLIERGYITEHQKLEALAARLDLQIIDLGAYPVDVNAVEKIPMRLAEKYLILGISITQTTLTVVTNDPLSFRAFDEITQLVGLELKITLAETPILSRSITFYYSEVNARAATRAVNIATIEERTEELIYEEGEGDAPIIKLLNSLLSRGYNQNASDIHIEPFETKTVIRMRVDGALVEFVTLKPSVHAPLIARIKIMSNLNIAEKRIPQDGHFRSKIDNELVNVRVSLIPTVFGEKAVLRILSSYSKIDNSGTFGMNEANYKVFSRMLSAPNGMVYITGPTGSGKTTTLYMALETVSARTVNISTIEDPVEKNLPAINQMQVNNMAGLTFDIGLRALLRQDPDVIMVGETRDSETANTAIRAAITGHLVLSTLHTNDAVGAVIRLEDMGVANYLLSGSLVGVIAQRLIRKVCPMCAVYEAPTAEELAVLGTDGKDIDRIAHPVGCEYCHKTGYNGRTAIHEILDIDKTIKKMITSGAQADDIRSYAAQNLGLVSLRSSAIELVRQGVTTIPEMMKLSYGEE